MPKPKIIKRYPEPKPKSHGNFSNTLIKSYDRV